MAEAVGLSIGSTKFTGVVTGRSAVTRQSVLTLYRHRAAELGVPSENPNINERGLVVTDFVERVGDPVGLVAPDGSVHRGEVLISDALRSLFRAVTGGRPPAEPPTIAYPAHWRRGSVDALRSALVAVPEWSGAEQQVSTISDATAAITALQADPGVPTRGVIALCDFGGAGTSVTLLDAGAGYRPVGPTVRHADFSGDLIDQALLMHVIADLSTAGAVDVFRTSALGSLNRLRAQCRIAKERLSAGTVAPLSVDLPGFHSDVRLTRTELDDEIGQPLAEFVGVLQDTLDRAGIGSADLVAVASVGGGANIPVITTTLSQHFRVPVITTARAELTAATGAGLRAARGPSDERATAMAPAAVAVVIPDPGPQSSSFRALAWSEAHDLPPIAPVAEPYEYASDEAAGLSSARPELQFEDEVADGAAEATAPPWHRRPAVLAAAGLIAVLLLGTAAMVAFRRDSSPASSTTPLVPSSTTPVAVPTEAAVQPPARSGQQDAPQPRTVVVAPPPAIQAQETAPASAPVAAPPVSAAPPSADAPPPPSTGDTPPPAPSTDTPPPVTDTPTPTEIHQRPRLIPTIPPIPTIPGLPPLVPQQGG
ncbi:MAG: hypothetical protein QOE41_3749 [Mycobacterium sp.]|nr:hypothetical protein [Mycobacterium sp.]